MSGETSLRDDASTLGRCPRCDEPLGRHSLLIEYETASGDAGRFASCATCEDVVAPTPTRRTG